MDFLAEKKLKAEKIAAEMWMRKYAYQYMVDGELDIDSLAIDAGSNFRLSVGKDNELPQWLWEIAELIGNDLKYLKVINADQKKHIC